METEVSESKKLVSLTVKIGDNETTYQVRRGLGMEAISLKLKLPLEFDCRNADCGICIFTCHKDGLSHLEDQEKEYLNALKALPNERLGCQTRIFDDTEIEIQTDW